MTSPLHWNLSLSQGLYNQTLSGDTDGTVTTSSNCMLGDVYYKVGHGVEVGIYTPDGCIGTAAGYDSDTNRAYVTQTSVVPSLEEYIPTDTTGPVSINVTASLPWYKQYAINTASCFCVDYELTAIANADGTFALEHKWSLNHRRAAYGLALIGAVVAYSNPVTAPVGVGAGAYALFLGTPSVAVGGETTTALIDDLTHLMERPGPLDQVAIQTRMDTLYQASVGGFSSVPSSIEGLAAVVGEYPAPFTYESEGTGPQVLDVSSFAAHPPVISPITVPPTGARRIVEDLNRRSPNWGHEVAGRFNSRADKSFRNLVFDTGAVLTGTGCTATLSFGAGQLAFLGPSLAIGGVGLVLVGCSRISRRSVGEGAFAYGDKVIKIKRTRRRRPLARNLNRVFLSCEGREVVLTNDHINQPGFTAGLNGLAEKLGVPGPQYMLPVEYIFHDDIRNPSVTVRLSNQYLSDIRTMYSCLPSSVQPTVPSGETQLFGAVCLSTDPDVYPTVATVDSVPMVRFKVLVNVLAVIEYRVEADEAWVEASDATPLLIGTPVAMAVVFDSATQQYTLRVSENHSVPLGASLDRVALGSESARVAM
ncbi:hypothetical protein KIPB_001731 [Kipferlia bialata]|uniref:Uncharacterized protein n=1 Tax=Kipferlia bialata TaxID=797122 RepID=A0A391NUM0_9EUKA|nr:hypothetical protein KIPB_001731 [Kipferlia bialata]|eukprot:g1731.t1